LHLKQRKNYMNEDRHSQTNPPKAPVNKEAFKMLAIEIGLNEAARRLGIPIPTAKSWARRGKWNLPRRKGGGRPKAYPVSSQHPVADALDASREELLDTASTAILRAIAKTATEAAKKGALDVATVSELSQLANALARARGDKSQVNVAVSNQVGLGVVVTEEQRNELIARLKRLQAMRDDSEKQDPAVFPPTPETQLQVNVGAENSPCGAHAAVRTSPSPSMRALGFDLAMPESVLGD
jgi:hypothetical protein